MINRRAVLAGSAALTTMMASGASGMGGMTGVKGPHRPDVTKRIAALEVGQARLGVCLLDTATGEHSGHRLDEHFAFCSTFKLPLVAACLREGDAGRLNLADVLPYTKADLLEWAPVTGPNVAKGGLPSLELAQAAQQFSDGGAANLLVRRLGGPAAVTQKFREMGDRVTRLDRYEPMLGMVLSADLRDTTSPRAMAELVQRITTGNLLSFEARELLLEWMFDTRTGPKRLRAGLPGSWRVGNKTGTGRAPGTTNKCNDVAIVYPPGKAPIIISAYYDSGEYTDQTEDRHQAVLAEVGKIAADWAMA